MKTKEDCLNKYMPMILDDNFTREEKEEFIHKAMTEFAENYNTQPVAKVIDRETIKKIVEALKVEHKRRYGERMVVSGPDNKYSYVPRILSYKLIHLYDDLEFALNHLHLDK